MEIQVAVSPGLHPENIRALEGFDNETEPYVRPAIEAMSTLYQGLADIHAARKAARENPTLNEAAQVIAVADYADKVRARAAKKVDAAVDTLTRGIKFTDEALSSPLAAAAGVSPLHMEIRAHVKALDTDGRMKWFNEALRNGDTLSLVAVLGAPSYLSGMSEEMKVTHLRHYHMHTNPSAARRLKVMQGALDILTTRAPAGLFQEVEKAVGAPARKVDALRKAKTKAEEAFILRQSDPAL